MRILGVALCVWPIVVAIAVMTYCIGPLAAGAIIGLTAAVIGSIVLGCNLVERGGTGK